MSESVSVLLYLFICFAFRFHIKVKAHSMSFSIWHFAKFDILQIYHAVPTGKILFFFIDSNILLYTHTHTDTYISSRSIHMSENWGCFYISSLLEIMLQWTFGCIHIFELVFLFSSDRYPGMELLNRIMQVHAKSLQSCSTLCNLMET